MFKELKEILCIHKKDALTKNKAINLFKNHNEYDNEKVYSILEDEVCWFIFEIE